MRLGCFGTAKDIEAVAEAGFDFIELDLRELIGLEEETFVSLCRRLTEFGVGADVCSWVLPSELDLTAADTSYSDWQEYVRIGITRSRAIGAGVWVIGSGKGRSIKLGNGPEDEQKARVADFIEQLAAQAGKADILVGIEPLGPDYSNYLCTLKETAAFVDGLGLGNVDVMCDLRHMTASGDTPDEAARMSGRLLHAHIDRPVGKTRRFPRRDDGWDYMPYLRAVSGMKAGRLSVEALDEEDLRTGSESVAYLRQLWAAAETEAADK